MSNTAAERRGNTFRGFKDLDPKTKDTIWPSLSCVCHIRYTAVSLLPTFMFFFGIMGKARLRTEKTRTHQVCLLPLALLKPVGLYFVQKHPREETSDSNSSDKVTELKQNNFAEM
jgi:hypothetical protein